MTPVVQKTQTSEQVYEWLRAETERRGLDITLYTNAASQENRFLIVPTYLVGGMDAYDIAAELQDLEDAWNDQEPRPYWLLILRPAAKPRENSPNGHQ